MFSDTAFDRALETIKIKYDSVIAQNKELNKAVTSMRDEHYKDSELSALKEENGKLRKRCNMYGLREEDYNKLMNWWKEHKASAHSREVEMDKKAETKMPRTPSYHIEIYEFAECTCYSIKCSRCGKSENVYY